MSREPHPERIRIVGVVAGEPQNAVLASVTLRAEGSETPSGPWMKPFDLTLKNGEQVHVEPSADTRLLAPETSLRGAWGSLEAKPLAAPFRAQAPGPHVEVKLRGKVISTGDTVEILAEVVSREPVDGPMGLRHSPQMRISAVRALIVGAGPEAHKAIDAAFDTGFEDAPQLSRTANPSPPGSWKRVPVYAGVALFVLLLGKAIFASRTVLLDLVVVVLVVGSWFYDLAELDSATPRFRAGAEPKNNTERHGSLIAGFVGSIIIVFCCLADIIRALSGSTNNTHPWPALTGAVVLSAMLISAGIATRYPLKMARILLAPPSEKVPGDGEWGVASGTVSDPTPTTDTIEPVALAVRTGAEERQLLHEGTFFVNTPSGQVEIDPAGAVWASSVLKSKTVTDGTETKTRSEEVIPIGANLVFAGRWKHRPGSCPIISGQGPESLVMFAVTPGLEATAQLRALLRARSRAFWADSVGLLVLAAIAAFGR